MGKVRYGLKNVHYAVWDPEQKTYGTPKAAPGAVSMTINANGSTSTFRADNVDYATFSSNGGYDGTLELGVAEDEMLKDLLGYIESNSMTLEPTDAKASEFALMFEVAGNELNQRMVFYNCTLSRPNLNANTTNEQITPDTQQMNFKAVGRDLEVAGETRNIVKGTIENTTSNATKYNAFMDNVLLPTASV